MPGSQVVKNYRKGPKENETEQTKKKMKARLLKRKYNNKDNLKSRNNAIYIIQGKNFATMLYY